MINGFGIDEEKYKQILAKNLTAAMEKRDISQRELARRLGVSSTTVSQWCAGKISPRMNRVDAICKILNLKRSDLMLSKEEAPAPEPTDEDIALARKIAALDPYRRQLIEAIINTEPETKK